MFGLSRFEWLVLAGALLLCPGMSYGQAGSGATAPAAKPADPPAASVAARSLFDRLDRNQDGYLSAEELASDEAKSRNWIAVDRNRDGRISRAEFGLVENFASTPQQPSAAAGASAAPKKE